jgi:rare lipoprotein A
MGRETLLIILGGLLLAVPGCAARSPAPAPTAGRLGILEVREGLASYYGPGFDGKTTASGVRFDMNAMVAAHPTYPFGTVVRVTNLTNRRAVEVRILDRGPAQGPRAAGVVIDLSYGAAQALGFIQDGLTRVRLEVLRWGN